MIYLCANINNDLNNTTIYVKEHIDLNHSDFSQSMFFVNDANKYQMINMNIKIISQIFLFYLADRKEYSN